MGYNTWGIIKVKHKLIVFDWNGTLLSDTIPSWKASNICLEFFGKSPISINHFRETFDFPVLHFYTKNGISVDEMIKRQDESNIVFQDAYESLSAKCRLRKGARRLLQHCHDQEYSCIILSNHVTEKIKTHLKRLKIDHHFKHVDAHNCDGTTILHKTTKTERLSAYMEKNGYEPEDTTIIGDSREEPAIARQLGLTSIGITNGIISTKRLKKSKPHYIVSNLNEIMDLI